VSSRRRLAIGGLVVAVLAVLAGGSFVVLEGRGDDDSQGTAPAPGVVTTVVDASGSPPELRNTGEDWDQIVRSIYAFEHWLYVHPQNAHLLERTELPSFPGFADRQLGIRNLATKGWRYDPPRRPVNVELVRLQDRPRADIAVVFVRSFDPPNRVVDATGAVIVDSPGSGTASVLWTLQREPASDSRWRIAKVTPFSQEPPRP
jgi:hypothetical protein